MIYYSPYPTLTNLRGVSPAAMAVAAQSSTFKTPGLVQIAPAAPPPAMPGAPPPGYYWPPPAPPDNQWIFWGALLALGAVAGVYYWKRKG